MDFSYWLRMLSAPLPVKRSKFSSVLLMRLSRRSSFSRKMRCSRRMLWVSASSKLSTRCLYVSMARSDF